MGTGRSEGEPRLTVFEGRLRIESAPITVVPGKSPRRLQYVDKTDLVRF